MSVNKLFISKTSHHIISYDQFMKSEWYADKEKLYQTMVRSAFGHIHSCWWGWSEQLQGLRYHQQATFGMGGQHSAFLHSYYSKYFNS